MMQYVVMFSDWVAVENYYTLYYWLFIEIVTY